MGKGAQAALVAACIIGYCSGIPASNAQSVTVIGGGLATVCSKAANFAADVGYVDPADIVTCGLAMDEEVLSDHEMAATYVNRGILYLTSINYGKANKDFDAAIKLEPTMGVGYVNRGAALIVQKKFRQGIADINRGLALNPDQQEKAYFNRALAEEYLDDMKDAYLDYMKALELRPGWDKPQKELVRFTVTRPGDGGSGQTEAVR